MKSLGQTAQAFLQRVDETLPQEPSRHDYRVAVADALRGRNFRPFTEGLRSLADAAYKSEGSDGIKAYLSAQSKLPLTPAQSQTARKTLGPALQASLRKGRKQLDNHDSEEAFALTHGLELIQGSIRDTYEAPVVMNEDDWQAAMTEGLQAAYARATPEQIEALAGGLKTDLDAWQRMPGKVTFTAILKSFLQSGTLARRTYQFLDNVRKELSDKPTQEEFQSVVQTLLKARRFRSFAPGLAALTEAAWAEQGPDGIDCYLQQQSEIAFDADVRDAWNRSVRQNMGTVLSAVVQPNKKEITSADTVAAFALEHGLELLDETIKDRYQAPKVEDIDTWRHEVTQRLSAELKKLDPSEPTVDLNKVKQLTEGLQTSFEDWSARPPGEQANLLKKVQTLAADLKEQPKEVLLESLKDLAWKLNKAPTEALLITATATSIAMLAQVGITVSTLPAGMAALTLAMSATAVMAGLFAADLQGGVFHHRHDNYPGGRTSKAFVDHHYDPRAVSTWSLIRNTHGTARGMTPTLLAAAALIPGGQVGAATAAFTVAFLNGLLYTQHIHGKSHAPESELSPLERFLQSIPIVPVFVPPDKHREHHSKPLGKEVYGVLNGWSNALADKTKFYRAIEVVREHFTGQEPGWKDELRLREEAVARKRVGRRPVNSC